MPTTLTLAFISSAFNEEENLEELHRRCRAVHAELEQEFLDRFELRFKMLVADNGSEDDSLAVLEELRRRDPALEVLVNRRNYGAEASAGNLIQQSQAFDLSLFLASDLQDPPEVGMKMVRALLERPELDAVLAVKKRSAGGPLLRLARRIYYRGLGLTSRRAHVATGYHGFGCYRQKVTEEAASLWTSTEMNVRQCLTNACHAPLLIDYIQPERIGGVSSYRAWGYWEVALASLLKGDAATSRLAVATGSMGLLLAVLLGLLLLVNYLQGNSGYSSGMPTLMGILLISFGLQMLMFGMLSRQIEGLRMGTFRRHVLFRKLDE